MHKMHCGHRLKPFPIIFGDFWEIGKKSPKKNEISRKSSQISASRPPIWTIIWTTGTARHWQNALRAPFWAIPNHFWWFWRNSPKTPKNDTKIDILNVSSRDETVVWKNPPGLNLRHEVEKNILEMLSTQLSWNHQYCTTKIDDVYGCWEQTLCVCDSQNVSDLSHQSTNWDDSLGARHRKICTKRTADPVWAHSQQGSGT